MAFQCIWCSNPIESNSDNCCSLDCCQAHYTWLGRLSAGLEKKLFTGPVNPNQFNKLPVPLIEDE